MLRKDIHNLILNLPAILAKQEKDALARFEKEKSDLISSQAAETKRYEKEREAAERYALEEAVRVLEEEERIDNEVSKRAKASFSCLASMAGKFFSYLICAALAFSFSCNATFSACSLSFFSIIRFLSARRAARSLSFLAASRLAFATFSSCKAFL